MRMVEKSQKGGVGDVEAAPSYQLVGGWVAARHCEVDGLEMIGKLLGVSRGWR
jgi:hypothetical protein